MTTVGTHEIWCEQSKFGKEEYKDRHFKQTAHPQDDLAHQTKIIINEEVVPDRWRNSVSGQEVDHERRDQKITESNAQQELKSDPEDHTLGTFRLVFFQ